MRTPYPSCIPASPAVSHSLRHTFISVGLVTEAWHLLTEPNVEEVGLKNRSKIEMAWLQRSCVSRCTSSPATVPVAASTLLQRAAVFRMQSRRFSVCRASCENRSADVLPAEEAGQAPVIFKDEPHGVVCYNDENGDVTCEGWDEGPHFHPNAQQPTLRRRRFSTPSAGQGRRGAETFDFDNVKGRMRESLGEAANESLESSEL